MFDWLRPAGVRPAWQTIIGIAVGFAGVTVLVSARPAAGTALDLGGISVLVAASMAWAIGSLYTKYSPEPESPLMTAAQQMILGGVVLLLIGLTFREPAGFEWSRVSLRSLAAFGYLTLIGSLVGFSAYAFLLKATTPARVATYAYVNPVIALLLGWLFGGESLTPRMVLAAAIIVLGVVIITSRNSSAKEPEVIAAAGPLKSVT